MQMASTSQAIRADPTQEDSGLDDDTVTNRPKDSKLRQQKLPAWQPILTAGTVVPSFFIVGIIFLPLGIALYLSSAAVVEIVRGFRFAFLPLGIALYLSSAAVVEIVKDYTECEMSNAAEWGAKPGTLCKDFLANETRKRWPRRCECRIQIQVPEDLNGDVFFYYGLSNFYQNHRRYVKSRSDVQLLGDLDNVDGCKPIQEMKEGEKTVKVAPCGSVANSLFNDTFSLLNSSSYSPVALTWKGVTWPTDRGHKFKNPSGNLGPLFAKYHRPPSWLLSADKLDNATLGNNALENTDFIVWMRTSALPTFRKLWRRLDGASLARGVYTLQLEYNYPVQAFDGNKRFIVSTAGWAGGKNSFLGVAYLVVGTLCLLLAALFLFIHLKFGKSLTEMSNINPQGRP